MLHQTSGAVIRPFKKKGEKMIIDLILDRKGWAEEGWKDYNANNFYHDVREYEETFKAGAFFNPERTEKNGKL